MHFEEAITLPDYDSHFTSLNKAVLMSFDVWNYYIYQLILALDEYDEM